MTTVLGVFLSLLCKHIDLYDITGFWSGSVLRMQVKQFQTANEQKDLVQGPGVGAW